MKIFIDAPGERDVGINSGETTIVTDLVINDAEDKEFMRCVIKACFVQLYDQDNLRVRFEDEKEY